MSAGFSRFVDRVPSLNRKSILTKGVPIMPEHIEPGSDIGQLADNLLWQMRNYLNAVHSKLAAIDAVLAAQAPPTEQPGGGKFELEK
jgi:hypothetical protein